MILARLQIDQSVTVFVFSPNPLYVMIRVSRGIETMKHAWVQGCEGDDEIFCRVNESFKAKVIGEGMNE